jgi:hypothetical protein
MDVTEVRFAARVRKKMIFFLTAMIKASDPDPPPEFTSRS